MGNLSTYQSNVETAALEGSSDLGCDINIQTAHTTPILTLILLKSFIIYNS